MKRTSCFSAAAAALAIGAFVLTGCKDDSLVPDGPGEGTSPELIIDVTGENIEIPAEGGNVEVTYELTNPVEDGYVSASCEVDWIVDLDWETAGKVVVSAEKNDSGTSRSATLTVTYTWTGGEPVEDEVELVQPAAGESGEDYDYEYEMNEFLAYFYEAYGNDGEDNYYVWLSDRPFSEDGYADGHTGEINAPDCRDRLDSLKKAVYEGQRAVYDSLYAEGVIWAEKTLEEDACAVALLKSLEYVDEDRIAVLGWSMGAHRAWLLAGCCADVATGVSVGWMTLKETLGPQLKASDCAMLIPALREKYDFPDIARLLAPKPYCFLSGREDRLFPAESTERAFERMRNIYSDAGAGGLLETGFVDGPHHCGKEAQAAATAFLERIFGMHD